MILLNEAQQPVKLGNLRFETIKLPVSEEDKEIGKKWAIIAFQNSSAFRLKSREHASGESNTTPISDFRAFTAQWVVCKYFKFLYDKKQFFQDKPLFKPDGFKFSEPQINVPHDFYDMLVNGEGVDIKNESHNDPSSGDPVQIKVQQALGPKARYGKIKYYLHTYYKFDRKTNQDKIVIWAITDAQEILKQIEKLQNLQNRLRWVDEGRSKDDITKLVKEVEEIPIKLRNVGESYNMSYKKDPFIVTRYQIAFVHVPFLYSPVKWIYPGFEHLDYYPFIKY